MVPLLLAAPLGEQALQAAAAVQPTSRTTDRRALDDQEQTGLPVAL